MRPLRLLALAAAVAAVASWPAAAHPPTLAGTPLLELYGQGIQRTLRTIPNCGIPPFLACDYRNPRFASWHVVLFTDGRASVSIVENALQDSAGAHAEAVLGPGDPSLFALVRQALAESRIGFARGDCWVSPDFPTPGTNDQAEILRFDWRVTWYGRSNRIVVFELPVQPALQPPLRDLPLCTDELARLIEGAVEYAHSVRQAAAR